MNTAVLMADCIDESAILISPKIVDRIEKKDDRLIKFFKSVRLKGIEYPVDVYMLMT